MRWFAALLVSSLLAAPAVAGEADPHAAVHALLARVLAAYGGREVLAGVHAYRMEGDVFSAMRHATAPTVRVFARPDHFKSLVRYEDAPEARIADGARVWRNEPGSDLEVATGPMRGAVILQAVRAALPWVLAERESLLTLDANTPSPAATGEDGSAVRVIALVLPLGDGLVLRAWVDAGGIIRVSQGLMDHGGMQTHFETFYSDFEQVDGVRFAFHEDNWASGIQTGITALKTVIVNPELRPDEFAPPLGAPGSPRTKQ